MRDRNCAIHDHHPSSPLTITQSPTLPTALMMEGTNKSEERKKERQKRTFRSGALSSNWSEESISPVSLSEFHTLRTVMDQKRQTAVGAF